MSNRKVVVIDETGDRSCLGTGVAVIGALLSGCWLLNFSAGIVELPDNFPIVGNLDEAAASAIFLGCLRYLGIDLLPFGRKQKTETREIIDVTPHEKK